MSHDTMANVLMISTAVCWTLAYLLIIRRSMKDKVYGMPIAACAANLAWEFFYSFIEPFPPPQLYVNIVWFAIDVVIFCQVITYAQSDFPKWPRPILSALIVSALPLAYLIICFSHQARIVPVSSAFAQSFMMSALFIGLLVRRGSMSGQTIYIGILKTIGTLLIAVLLYFVYKVHRQLSIMTFLYISVLGLDITYVALLFFQIRKQGYNPWVRW